MYTGCICIFACLLCACFVCSCMHVCIHVMYACNECKCIVCACLHSCEHTAYMLIRLRWVILWHNDFLKTITLVGALINLRPVLLDLVQLSHLSIKVDHHLSAFYAFIYGLDRADIVY